jgi:hypothetical protein
MKNFFKTLYSKYIQKPLLLTEKYEIISSDIYHKNMDDYIKKFNAAKTLYEQDKLYLEYHKTPMRDDQWYFKPAWYEKVKRIEGKHQIVINLYGFRNQWERFYYPEQTYGYNHFYHLDRIEEYERTNSLVNRNGNVCILLRWEVRKWLLKNAGRGCFTVRPSRDCIVFGFDNSNVAMMFLLAWGLG